VKAAIYCRVSSDGQEDNTSLPTQEEACRRFAAERGYVVDDIYREVQSGFDLWERPQLTALREAARRGQVQAVIAYALDRLSRNQTHIAILDDEWERTGVALLFVTEEFEKTPEGKLIRSVKGFAAELEREKIRERTQRGRLARAQSGRLMPGRRPLYGYRYRDEGHTAYAIDLDTSPIVRAIFASAAIGVPTRAIASDLEKRHPLTGRVAALVSHHDQRHPAQSRLRRPGGRLPVPGHEAGRREARQIGAGRRAAGAAPCGDRTAASG